MFNSIISIIKKTNIHIPNVIPKADVSKFSGFAKKKINNKSKTNLLNIPIVHIFIVFSIDLFFIILKTSKLMRKSTIFNKIAAITDGNIYGLIFIVLFNSSEEVIETNKYAEQQ